MSTIGRPPPDLTLNALSQQVIERVSRYTTLGWPIMMAQCRRANVDPANLQPQDVSAIMAFLTAGVARFTSPENAEKLEADLAPLQTPRWGSTG